MLQYIYNLKDNECSNYEIFSRAVVPIGVSPVFHFFLRKILKNTLIFIKFKWNNRKNLKYNFAVVECANFCKENCSVVGSEKFIIHKSSIAKKHKCAYRKCPAEAENYLLHLDNYNEYLLI